MNRLVVPPDPLKSPPAWQLMVTRGLHWLSEPKATLPEPDQRRSRLLAWLVLALFVLSLVSFVLLLTTVLNSPGFRAGDAFFAGAVAVVLGVAFWQNRMGHLRVASWLTVAAVLLGTWGTVFVDPAGLVNNSLPLIFPVIAILVAALLLSTLASLILAAADLLALGLIAVLDPALIALPWVWILVLVFLLSAAGVLANLVMRKDRDQLERQGRQLIESEALLQEQSVRDPLTGLFTRRYLEETLERELRRSERDHLPLGVIMLDLDHFKEFNEANGRAAGDAVLLQIGLLLRAHIRSADFACRYGGEAFMVILPEAPREVTRQRAELLLDNARRVHAQHDGKTLGGVTISLGVVFYPDHGTTRVTILRSVGDALFRAKREGGDRLVVAE
jgi:diguanylate cyclase (GGDEF)-like protein